MVHHPPASIFLRENIRGDQPRRFPGSSREACHIGTRAEHMHLHRAALNAGRTRMLKDAAPRSHHGVSAHNHAHAWVHARHRRLMRPERFHCSQVTVAKGAVKRFVNGSQLIFQRRHFDLEYVKNAVRVCNSSWRAIPVASAQSSVPLLSSASASALRARTPERARLRCFLISSIAS